MEVKREEESRGRRELNSMRARQEGNKGRIRGKNEDNQDSE